MECIMTSEGCKIKSLCIHAMSCQKKEAFRLTHDRILGDGLVELLGMPPVTADMLVDTLNKMGYAIVRKELIKQ